MSRDKLKMSRDKARQMLKTRTYEDPLAYRVKVRLAAMGMTAAELGRHLGKGDKEKALAIARQIRDASLKSSVLTVVAVAQYLDLYNHEGNDPNDPLFSVGALCVLDDELLDYEPKP